MRTDSFPNLNPANVLFADIAQDFTRVDFRAIGKGHDASNRVNIIDMIALILFHLFGKSIQIIIDSDNTGFTLDGFIIFDFKFQSGHGRLFR